MSKKSKPSVLHTTILPLCLILACLSLPVYIYGEVSSFQNTIRANKYRKAAVTLLVVGLTGGIVASMADTKDKGWTVPGVTTKPKSRKK